MTQLKNYRKIGLKIISDFYDRTEAHQYFDDPRFTMSDIAMTCSLLRKEFTRKGYINKFLYPKTVRGEEFDKVVALLERVLEKIKINKIRWKEKKNHE